MYFTPDLSKRRGGARSATLRLVKQVPRLLAREDLKRLSFVQKKYSNVDHPSPSKKHIRVGGKNQSGQSSSQFVDDPQF